ncbi:MAG TPA: hypothetical protein VLL05_11385 [Terriglobales bacterium]|nr:hypothetical protein [Terriglobales bacterium]
MFEHIREQKLTAAIHEGNAGKINQNGAGARARKSVAPTLLGLGGAGAAQSSFKHERDASVVFGEGRLQHGCRGRECIARANHNGSLFSDFGVLNE